MVIWGWKIVLFMNVSSFPGCLYREVPLYLPRTHVHTMDTVKEIQTISVIMKIQSCMIRGTDKLSLTISLSVSQYCQPKSYIN